jgi:hypothetical protein
MMRIFSIVAMQEDLKESLLDGSFSLSTVWWSLFQKSIIHDWAAHLFADEDQPKKETSRRG